MITVRRAILDDAPALGRAHAASWRAAYAGLGAEFLASIDDEERIALFTRIIGDGSGGPVLVAEADASIVGFVNVRGARDEGAAVTQGEVVAIYVRPEAWGTGTGRALMDAAVGELAAMGFTEAILWVLADNGRARRFYETAGWHPDGAEKDEVWRGAPIHEVRYTRSLPSHG